jgi:hypothetical protein
MKDFLELLDEGDGLDSNVSSFHSRIANFEEKLIGFMELMANKKGFSSNKWKYLLKEAETTTDFPYLFGTVLERQLYAKYMAADPDWRTYIKTGTQNDFRPSWLIGVYGLTGPLQKVKQRDEYKADAVLADGKVAISLDKYGREFPLSWETLINDDLGALTDVAERFALAARRTEYRAATGLYVLTTGPHTSLFGTALAHPIDGKTINNKFSSANKVTVIDTLGVSTQVTPTFNIDTLSAACSVMRRFVDADGEPVIFEGFELVVPPALEIRMLQALNPANIIMAGGDSTTGIRPAIRSSSNTVPQLNITGHVNPYLPIMDTSGNGNNTWYLFARLAGAGYAARMNFLKGHENPEVCMKNPDKVSLGGGVMSPLEGDYQSDSIRWRVRHCLGGTQVDPRYAAAFIGA